MPPPPRLDLPGLDPRTNPAFLKLDLLCRGARVHDVEGPPPPEAARRTAASALAGGRPILRTRAGLGSGLELRLTPRLYVNVPVLERFAAASPYELRPGAAPGTVEIARDGAPCAQARLAPGPAWYEQIGPGGRPLRRVATLQGTTLAVYPGRVCDFWVRSEVRPARESCAFCSLGLNLGADDGLAKSVDEVLAAVHAARRENGITYVDFNAGHADDAGFLDALEPYVRRVKRETGLLVGVQTPPHPDPARWRRLRTLGVNRVSFCFELFDPQRFAAVCPGKARVYGQAGYFEAIERCLALASVGPRGEPWVVNGELIAGLEPAERSMAAIDWLTERGAIPTVCVFRPLTGTPLEHAAAPPTEEVLPVFQHLYRRCLERGLPVGVAPNVHVSLVLLPEEARGLLTDPVLRRSLRRHERALALKRLLLGGYLRTRLRLQRARPAPRPVSRT